MNPKSTLIRPRPPPMYSNHLSPKSDFTKPTKHLKPRKPVSQKENQPKAPAHSTAHRRAIPTATRAEARTVRQPSRVASGTTRKLVISDSSGSSDVSESESEAAPVKGKKKTVSKVKKEPVEGGGLTLCMYGVHVRWMTLYRFPHLVFVHAMILT